MTTTTHKATPGVRTSASSPLAAVAPALQTRPARTAPSRGVIVPERDPAAIAHLLVSRDRHGRRGMDYPGSAAALFHAPHWRRLLGDRRGVRGVDHLGSAATLIHAPRWRRRRQRGDRCGFRGVDHSDRPSLPHKARRSDPCATALALRATQLAAYPLVARHAVVVEGRAARARQSPLRHGGVTAQVPLVVDHAGPTCHCTAEWFSRLGEQAHHRGATAHRRGRQAHHRGANVSACSNGEYGIVYGLYGR